VLLSYAGIPHPSNECAVAIQRKPTYSEGHFRKGYVETWTITGLLQSTLAPGATTIQQQQAVTALVLALQTTYNVNGGDLVLYDDAGSPSAHSILSKSTLGGTRVIELPSYPTSEMGEYAGWRHYVVVVEAEYLDPKINLITWNESIEGSGGSYRRVALQPINGAPQIQQVASQTPFKATQSGRAVGQLAYPTPSPPIWPSALVEAPRIKKEDPERWGPPGAAQYVGYPITWHYEYLSTSVLAGNPTLWKP